jgi:hypothetical protein
MRRWSRSAAEPAHAFPATADRQPGRLPQRDFDPGRGLCLLPGGGPPPAATAALLTASDRRADWLRAGQALHRLLAHAASKWVFASLHTQPLESPPIRALIRDRLALPGSPQMLLQPGPVRATARRPPADPHRTLRSAPGMPGNRSYSYAATGPRPRLGRDGLSSPRIPSGHPGGPHAAINRRAEHAIMCLPAKANSPSNM